MSEPIFKDWTEVEKKSVVKNEARDVVLEALLGFLNESFIRAEQISNTEIAVIVGEATDEKGKNSEVCVRIPVKSMAWYHSVGEKGRETMPFKLEDEYEAYKRDLEAKAK